MGVASSCLKRPFSNASVPVTGQVYVRSILGTTQTKDDEDFWMTSVFVLLHQFIGARDELSRWTHGTPIRTDSFLSDSRCDRFFDRLPFEEVLDPRRLGAVFLADVIELAARIRHEDTLVLVLAGHDDTDTGDFIIGSPTSSHSHFRPKFLVESAVRSSKGQVVLITTVSHSGLWKSPLWALLAATRDDEESVSIVVSGSNQIRGRIFANASLAERVDQFRKGIGHTAQFGRKARNRAAYVLPFPPSTQLSLKKKLTSSPPSGNSQPSYRSNTPISSPLSNQEEEELKRHAKYLLDFSPPTTANEVTVLSSCMAVLYGHKDIDDKRRSRLLAGMRARVEMRKRALRIALSLGWEAAVDVVGKPNGRSLQKGAAHELERLADESGCHVDVLIVDTLARPWFGAAAWLARVWEASGSHVVTPRLWDEAVERSLDLGWDVDIE
jgi:hypothetical protein